VFLPLGRRVAIPRGHQARAADGRRLACGSIAVLYRELVAMDLLERVKIQISVFPELRYDFSGYHTINQEKLAALGSDQLLRLHRLGLLGPVFFLVSSLGNFQKLVNLKIARLQSA
jgi:hypothetical protein